ncbi:MAG: hypothetical protein H0X31_02765 [Nostocaceae cyanobacterium]|nr:hypothetical protein [Nostocaceae cyanobacterium]
METIAMSMDAQAIPETFGTEAECISFELIQTLPQSVKDAALYKLCKIVEAKPTLVESFALNQVLYRTISGGVFTESADSAAKRTGCDRKTILKGLNQAVKQNILEENRRAGTSNEYRFQPIEEWLPEPVVLSKDYPKNNLVQFPSTENSQPPVETEPVLTTDDHITDSNTVVIINNLLEEQQQEVNNPVEDTPTIWRRNPDASRYCQIPPIADQNTGVEIQRQMDIEGLTAQKVVSRAIAKRCRLKGGSRSAKCR